MTDEVEDTRRRLLEAADFMVQERAVYVPDLLLTAARLLGQLSRNAPLIAAAERERIIAILEALAAEWGKLRLGYRDMGDAEMATYIWSKEGALEVALAAIRATPPEDGGKP